MSSDHVVVDVEIQNTAQGVRVLIDGRPIDVAVGHPLARLQGNLNDASSKGHEEIKSPMPGLVVAIKVSEGDSVKAGQTVAIIEAMKMQNELAASIAGTIESIRAADGDTVESGAVLVVIQGLEGTGGSA